MSRKFQQYDVVRLIGFGPNADLNPSEHDKRPPQIGDTATIVEIYEDPPGYELECCDGSSEGITTWLRSFGVSEIILELLKPQVGSRDNSD